MDMSSPFFKPLYYPASDCKEREINNMQPKTFRDVVIARLLKDADKAFDNEQILDLSKEELMNIMSRKPQVKASKVMDVLIRWAKKKLALEETKKEEDTKTDETKEGKLDEEKKEDVKTDEKKEGDEEKKEAVSDDKAEVVELDDNIPTKYSNGNHRSYQ